MVYRTVEEIVNEVHVKVFPAIDVERMVMVSFYNFYSLSMDVTLAVYKDKVLDDVITDNSI